MNTVVIRDYVITYSEHIMIGIKWSILSIIFRRNVLKDTFRDNNNYCNCLLLNWEAYDRKKGKTNCGPK